MIGLTPEELNNLCDILEKDPEELTEWDRVSYGWICSGTLNFFEAEKEFFEPETTTLSIYTVDDCDKLAKTHLTIETNDPNMEMEFKEKFSAVIDKFIGLINKADGPMFNDMENSFTLSIVATNDVESIKSIVDSISKTNDDSYIKIINSKMENAPTSVNASEIPYTFSVIGDGSTVGIAPTITYTFIRK